MDTKGLESHDHLSWPNSAREAIEHQAEMAQKIELFGNFDDLKYIAAVDTAYGRDAEVVYAAAVVFAFPEIVEVERSFRYNRVTFPYEPGLFYYREGPTMLEALARLETEPDVIIVHGHGVAHPRRCGIAGQVGVAMGKPTIGCARRLLAGTHRPVSPLKGSQQTIVMKSKEVGYAYRSKENVKPIFISPGHLCNLEQARDIVVRCIRGYRVPEPLRFAHLYANKFKRRTEAKMGRTGSDTPPQVGSPQAMG